MDLDGYWQENKRFVLWVAGGLVVFLIAFLVLDNSYGAEARSSLARRNGLRRDLAKAYYGASDRDRAQEENDALRAAERALEEAVAFETREAFRLREGAGSSSNQYFGRVEAVRQDLTLLASRARMTLPEGLGIERLQTNDEEIIERHMEALDLLDRVLRLAVEAGVDRVVTLQTKLDPTLESRAGVGRIERTSVQLRFVADPPAVAAFLTLTQSDRFGKPLVVDQYDAKRVAGRDDEVSCDIRFLAVRLHAPQEELEDLEEE